MLTFHISRIILSSNETLFLNVIREICEIGLLKGAHVKPPRNLNVLWRFRILIHYNVETSIHGERERSFMEVKWRTNGIGRFQDEQRAFSIIMII